MATGADRYHGVLYILIISNLPTAIETLISASKSIAQQLGYLRLVHGAGPIIHITTNNLRTGSLGPLCQSLSTYGITGKSVLQVCSQFLLDFLQTGSTIPS